MEYFGKFCKETSLASRFVFLLAYFALQRLDQRMVVG